MQRHDRILAQMDEHEAEYLRLEPREDFDPCIVGIARRFNDCVLAYDIDLIIAMLVRRDGMEVDEAIDHFEFNIIGGWYGNATPVFLHSVASGDEEKAS